MTGGPHRSSFTHTTRRSDSVPMSPAQWSVGIRWLYPVATAETTWLVHEPTLFGRDESCHAPLPGDETSRQHAEAVRDGLLWMIRDLGSTNGVYVNGVRVGASVLSFGDIVRLGEWIGRVVHGSPDSMPEPSEFRCEHGLVAGPIMGPVLATAARGARTDLPVVVQGETGTGKELMARAVHAWSGRSGPFLAINCTALPEALAEAELFGYRKGAFTGADRSSLGHFRAARGGTLFLDEVTDLAPALQPKLLRVLEQHEVIPVGESVAQDVDVRIVVATQVPLRDKVRERGFRADLQARLDGVTIVLPPLRERIDEVPYLFDWFLRKHCGGSPPAVEPRLIEDLCLYSWPSNVRELELLTRRLVGMHGDSGRLRRTALPEHVLSRGLSAAAGAADDVEGFGAKDARDVGQLVKALRIHAGNIARAAAHAGIERRRAYRLLEAHPEIDLKAMRKPARRQPTKGKGDE